MPVSSYMNSRKIAGLLGELVRYIRKFKRHLLMLHLDLKGKIFNRLGKAP